MSNTLLLHMLQCCTDIAFYICVVVCQCAAVRLTVHVRVCLTVEVRCMAAVLLAVGRGLEVRSCATPAPSPRDALLSASSHSTIRLLARRPRPSAALSVSVRAFQAPGVVRELLDPALFPLKPSYDMASEVGRMNRRGGVENRESDYIQTDIRSVISTLIAPHIQSNTYTHIHTRSHFTSVETHVPFPVPFLQSAPRHAPYVHQHTSLLPSVPGCRQVKLLCRHRQLPLSAF